MKMTTAQFVEMSVTGNNNNPIQDFVHPDDQTQPTLLPLLKLSCCFVQLCTFFSTCSFIIASII